MLRSISAASACLALYASLTNAATTPQLRRDTQQGFTMKASGTGVRDMNAASSSSASASGTLLGLTDFKDLIYEVDIELAGNQFRVQLDSGSSDLWIFSPKADLKLTGKSKFVVKETYGIGEADGPVVFGELKLGAYTVPNQAFINATTAKNFAFFNQGAVGIMGLSFDDVNLSPINRAILADTPASTVGHTPLINIFLQNPQVAPSFDVRLDRTGDLDDTATGTFLISEHLSQFAHVEQQPKLLRQALGRWTVPMDDMVVNGRKFDFNKSSIATVPSGKIGVLLDTGFTAPPLPPAAVDAIYSTIPGAVKYVDSGHQWIVPCDASTNLTFSFGGQDFPVHPLDLTFVNTRTITQNGKKQDVTYCSNAFQYLTQKPDGFDAILGDAFLRNVYASFTFGNEKDIMSSFVQLVSTTDFASALPDFRASRSKALASLPPTIAPATLVKALGPASGSAASSSDAAASGALAGGDASSSAAPSSGGAAANASGVPYWITNDMLAAEVKAGAYSQYTFDLLNKWGPYVVGLLAANVFVGLLVFVVGIATCVRRGGVTRNPGASYTPVRFKTGADTYGRPSGTYSD